VLGVRVVVSDEQSGTPKPSASYLATKTPAHNVERPITLPTSRLAQLLPESNLLNIPRRSLDLDHVHMNDPLALVPYSLSTLVECPAFCAFEASFAGVKAG
jgi:hypothetical protein